MSTPKKYLCEGCPGTLQPRPIPYLGDMSGERLNERIRLMKRGDDELSAQAAERACDMIQAEQCNGPQEIQAKRYDNEGEFYIPNRTDLVCGRGLIEIMRISDAVHSQ